MKTKPVACRSRICARLPKVRLALITLLPYCTAWQMHAADAYWRTDGTTGGTWTSTYWNIGSANATGGTGWTSGNNAFFTADSSLTFATTSVGNVTLSDSVTVTITKALTLTLGGVRTFDIGANATLNWTSQNQSTAAGNEGAGVIKNGAGVLNWGAGPGNNARFNGGFTINNGIVIVSGAYAFGSGPMTVNGGTLQSSGSLSYTPTALTFGGNFEFSGTGDDIWSQPVNLGASTRTITNNTTSTATRTFSGPISGGAGAGLTFMGSGGSGGMVLSGTNTYTGNTTIGGGVLRLGPTGSIATSPVIVVSNSAIFDVSAAGFTLSPAQTLKGAGTIGGVVTNVGVIEPGSGIATLTFSNAPVLSGVLRMKVNRTSSPTADKLTLLSGALNYGGTLVITNVGPTLTSNTFTLFTAPAYSGAFTSLDLPGGIIHWRTNALTVNGTITFTNQAPQAANLSMGLSVGGAQTLAIIGGKHAPTDPEGDSLSVTAVTQGAHGSVTFTASNVTYTSTSNANTDSFTYTVADAYGATATATVNLTLSGANEGYNRLGDPVALGGNNFQLTYLGIPGLQYALDWSDDLASWVPQVTNKVGGNGRLIFTNNQSGSPNFWRTRYVP